ncbi:radical SAM/SPASM domain-containing protein [Granulicella arctica]|uniref:radical SAM/SPASM domain-containing protein n=1 Tax=Granulicella arctica TaxID=940613 RepID=UPI0021E03C21|nr:radical SAM protein [Granulicella arctica]
MLNANSSTDLNPESDATRPSKRASQPFVFPILDSPVWSQLSFLEFGPATLVMDRGSGRWAVIKTADAPLLRLLPVDVNLIPLTVRERCKTLAAELRGHGLGRPPQPSVHPLNTLILKLTQACNYACTYCYDFAPEEHASRLDLRAACNAVDEALTIAPSSLHVILHGGEPTLVFPLLREIVLRARDCAKRLGKRVTFGGQTNLSRINAEMVAFFAENNVVWGISLDGPPELNDRFRILHTGGGTYHFLTSALQNFPNFVRSCGVLTTVTSVTDVHLLTIVSHVRDLGFHAWDWSLFQPIGRGQSAVEPLNFNTQAVIQSWNELFEAVEAGSFEGFNIQAITRYLDNFLDGPGAHMCLRKDCGAGRDLMSVSANGTIEACDCIDPKGPLSSLGHITENSDGALAAARATGTAELIRSRNVELGMCSSCIWLAICGGTCLAHSHGSIHDVWKSECAIAINAFDRIARSVIHSDRLRDYRQSYRKAVAS